MSGRMSERVSAERVSAGMCRETAVGVGEPDGKRMRLSFADGDIHMLLILCLVVRCCLASAAIGCP